MSSEVDRGTVRLFTDKRVLVINQDNFKLEDFEIVNHSKNEQIIENKYLSIPTVEVETVITGEELNLKEIISDNIQKIRNDKEYISQANAINDQLKTLIDLAKTQILAQKIKK